MSVNTSNFFLTVDQWFFSTGGIRLFFSTKHSGKYGSGRFFPLVFLVTQFLSKMRSETVSVGANFCTNLFSYYVKSWSRADILFNLVFCSKRKILFKVESAPPWSFHLVQGAHSFLKTKFWDIFYFSYAIFMLNVYEIIWHDKFGYYRLGQNIIIFNKL